MTVFLEEPKVGIPVGNDEQYLATDLSTNQGAGESVSCITRALQEVTGSGWHLLKDAS